MSELKGFWLIGKKFQKVNMIEFLKKAFDKLPVSNGKREIFNLPNSITMLRICIIPVLFLLLLSPGRILSLIIAILFIIAAITDLLVQSPGGAKFTIDVKGQSNRSFWLVQRREIDPDHYFILV